MKWEAARQAMGKGCDVRRPSWEVGKFLRPRGPFGACWLLLDEHGMERVAENVSLTWDDLEADDWVAVDPSFRRKSVLEHPIWRVVRPYLGERPHELRGLEVRGLPRSLSLQLQRLELECVACGKLVRVFRRRQGSDWSHLYFSPACPSADSPGCSRGAECRDEFEAIRAKLRDEPSPQVQLGLFGGVR